MRFSCDQNQEIHKECTYMTLLNVNQVGVRLIFYVYSVGWNLLRVFYIGHICIFEHLSHVFCLTNYSNRTQLSKASMFSSHQIQITYLLFPSLFVKALKPQGLRNPYDIPRSHLLDQLSRMRRNLLQASMCILKGQDQGNAQTGMNGY